jgi:thiamine biosynthesis lipoprotein
VSKAVWIEHHMGMPISIHVRSALGRTPEMEQVVAAAYGQLRWVDETFSTYRDGSWVNRLRRGEVAMDLCPPEVGEVARRCLAAGEATGGAFTAWLPDANGVVRFDPTGLVKGWAVDRAAEQLARLAGASWAINAGGDVRVGRHRHVPPTGADADAWRIGVEDPTDRDRIARVVPLVEGGLATSGTAARGAHLYDPLTRQWIGRRGSTSVVAPTLEEADIWATALFVGTAATAARFAERAPRCTAFTL